MMAIFIQGKLKICFIFLLLIVFIGLASVQDSDIALKPSKVWLTSVSRHLQSLYSSTNISNEVLKQLLFPRDKPTAGEQIPNTTRVDVTTMNRFNAMQSIVQDTVSNVPKTQPYHGAHPHNYHFILDEPDTCKQQKPFLVLMVPVAPQQLEARNAIRSTWGNESVVQGKIVTVLFMLGLTEDAKDVKQQEQLNLESQQYHDLIQSNFKDTYQNLTTKTMLIMHWLSTHCPQASYAMKIDSDMFLNLNNLMNLLLAPNTPKENYITGMVMWNRPVVRNPFSKWYVPKEAYQEEVYPTYLLGMGYVFSNDLPEKLVNVSKDVQPFNIEDAYVGACLKKLHIPPSNPPDPSQFKAYHHGDYKRSEFARIITTILGSPQQLVTFWQDLKKNT